MGASLAQVFHDNGYEVVGLCRTQPAEFVRWIPSDMLDDQKMDEVVAKIRDEYSEFDVLIQCAGDGDGEEIDKLEWNKTHDVFTLNAIAPIVLTSKLLPLVKKNQADIINIGATIALKPYQYFSVY